jgi:L-fucose mutarotase
MRKNPGARSDDRMLKLIPPLLTPDALHALASMGHGDELAVVDAHFPAASTAARGKACVVHLSGADMPSVVRAVLQLMPLDAQGGDAALTMQVIGNAAAVPPAVAQLQSVLREAGERPAGTLERFAFYERAARAHAIVVSGESRTYGNVLLRKGVVFDGAAS